MNDWLGLTFFLLLALGAYLGLRVLSRPSTRTPEEFERNIAESSSLLSASMNALQEALNPEEAKARETIQQMKDGRYQKKKREGKANEDDWLTCGLGCPRSKSYD